VDIRAKLGKATQSQAAELFIKFFPHPVATTDPLSSSTDTTTSTTVAAAAAAAARSGRRQSVDYKGDITSSPTTSASGESSSPLLSEKPGSPTTVSSSIPSTSKPGRTQEEIERMATQFSKVIPDQQFSIAQLQGFLMGYKKTPELAVKHVDEFVRQAGSAEVSGTAKIGYDDDEEEEDKKEESDGDSDAAGKGKVALGDGKDEKQDYYWEGSEEQQKERKEFREEKERERRASLK
jgi:chaperone BCS1